MINQYFKQLSDNLKSDCLSWVEVIGKNVYYQTNKEGVKIPVQCFDEECKNPDEFLIPKSSIGSLMFFDVKKIDKLMDDDCFRVYNVDFDVFFWYKCNKVEVIVDGKEVDCCRKIDIIHSQVATCVRKLTKGMYNGTTFNIQDKFISENLKYHPYYMFKLNFNAKIEDNPCVDNQVQTIQINGISC